MSGCLAGFDLGADKLCSGLLRCIDASIPPPTAAQRASGYANAVRRHASPPPPVSERTAASVAVRASRSPPGYFCHWLAFFWRIDSGAAAVSPYHFPRRHRRRQPVASSHNYPLSLLSLSSAVSHRSPSWTWMNGSLYGCTYTTKKRKKIEGMVPKNLGIIVRGVEKTKKII